MSAGLDLADYPGGQPLPLASNLNYLAGQTIANMVLVPLGPVATVRFSTLRWADPRTLLKIGPSKLKSLIVKASHNHHGAERAEQWRNAAAVPAPVGLTES
jgi:hypothetical protein